MQESFMHGTIIRLCVCVSVSAVVLLQVNISETRTSYDAFVLTSISF